MINQYSKAVDPDELIRITMEAHIDGGELIISLLRLDKMYTKAGFNDRAKYGMLGKAAMEHNRLLEFLLLRGPATHDALKETFSEHVWNSKSFVSNFYFEDTGPAMCKAPAEVVHIDIRSHGSHEKGLDNRLIQFVQQFENFSMTI